MTNRKRLQLRYRQCKWSLLSGEPFEGRTKLIDGLLACDHASSHVMWSAMFLQGKCSAAQLLSGVDLINILFKHLI